MALAAKLRGIPAYVVIPKNAPKCKVENVKRYGGQIFWSESTMQSRESIAEKVQQDTGAILVHPFNNRFIIRFYICHRPLDIISIITLVPLKLVAFCPLSMFK